MATKTKKKMPARAPGPWTMWSPYLGQTVVVYTGTYHWRGVVEGFEIDPAGVATAHLVEAIQIGDERTPGRFEDALTCGTVDIPSSAVIAIRPVTVPL